MNFHQAFSKKGAIILKNRMFKLAIIVCIVSFAVPSYAVTSNLDPFGSKTVPGAAYKTERASFGVTSAPVEKSTNQDTNSDEQKKAIEKLRNDLKSDAIRETTGFAKLINERGAEAALETINKLIQQKGHTPKKGTVNGVSYVAYSFKTDTAPNAPVFVYQYSVHPDKNVCQVVTAIPALKIQEGATANYTEPAAKLTLTESVNKYLGLTLKDKQDKFNGSNGFKVLKLDPKGLAGKSGIKAGDLIIKIDAFEIRKDHTVDQICAFIDARREKKALMKIVLIRNGAKKNVNVQF